MSDTLSDFYHQKTDTELQFFVEHPELYQPSLVEAAQRELRRRGVPLSAPAVFTANQYMPARASANGSKVGVLNAVLAGALVVGMGAFYFVKQRNRPAPVLTAAPAAPAAAPKSPPHLTEVATSVIPNYDGLVAQCVEQQLKQVPAAERAAAKQANQPLRQYRELAKRFWTAQTQTEYVTEQARQNKLTAALPGHVEAVKGAWQQWNKATVYSYKLGPAMAGHLDLMTRVAQQQQEGLSDLLLVANNPQPFENEKTKKRAADVNDLLSGLLPKSPVTGQPYHAIVRRVRL